jgi:hypothetical protein
VWRLLSLFLDYPMPLSTIFDKLLDYAAQLQPAIRDHMQPGYDISTIRRIIPFDLPPAVVELYQWHKGENMNMLCPDPFGRLTSVWS